MHTLHWLFSVYRGEPGYSSGQSSSGSEFDPGRTKRKQKPSDFVRMTGRRTGVVSYKESSGTDSDEVMERREQQEMEEDNREAIERVLKKRIGQVGGESARAPLGIGQRKFPSSLSPLLPLSPLLLHSHPSYRDRQ